MLGNVAGHHNNSRFILPVNLIQWEGEVRGSLQIITAGKTLIFCLSASEKKIQAHSSQGVITVNIDTVQLWIFFAVFRKFAALTSDTHTSLILPRFKPSSLFPMHRWKCLILDSSCFNGLQVTETERLQV